MQQVRLPHSPLGLRGRVTCPHCWHEFPPHDVRWVSAHPDLNGDPKLGGDALLRFLPSRFNVQGQALDAHGVPCTELACPHCHLRVSRALLEMKPFVFTLQPDRAHVGPKTGGGSGSARRRMPGAPSAVSCKCN